MDRRKELKQQAKERSVEAGVYAVRNTRNGKVLVMSTRNLATIHGQQFMLEMGSHINKALQREWNEYGKDAFAFEVLEVLKKEDSPYFDEKGELKKLEQAWLERLQPFGERGYHKGP